MCARARVTTNHRARRRRVEREAVDEQGEQEATVTRHVYQMVEGSAAINQLRAVVEKDERIAMVIGVAQLREMLNVKRHVTISMQHKVNALLMQRLSHRVIQRRRVVVEEHDSIDLVGEQLGYVAQ